MAKLKISELIGIAEPEYGRHWSAISSAEIDAFCLVNGITNKKAFCAQLITSTKAVPGKRIWLRSGVSEDALLGLYWKDVKYCRDRIEDIGGGIEFQPR